MSRSKRLVLTFDAFGTLFTPREPIGQQYVCTLTIFLHLAYRDTYLGHGKVSASSTVLFRFVILLKLM